jgi:tetratricopeptide (TPR) repeat protein
MSSCKKDNIVSSEPPTNKDFERAELFKKNNITDSAFYYFNLSKNSFLEKNDSIGAARALVNMAFIQNTKGDFFGSIETSLESNKFLKNENNAIAKKILTSNYNNIANASNSLKSFDSALVYYKKAIRYADNDEAKYICYNNIGDVLISQGNLKLAKTYLEKAIHAENIDNYARALNNFAKAKYLDDKNYNPLPEIVKALEIRKKTRDNLDLNSSFETLSTYYLNKDRNLSLEFAKKMLTEATNNNSPNDQITALKRIVTLEPENYLQNFQKFDSINDNIQTERNRHKSQFAMVRYDVEQKNTDNQRLKNQTFQQNIGLGALALALIGGAFYYKKRKKRLEQEKELEVKNTELKYSKKVHDKVANKVYHVMSEVENTPAVNKEELLDKLETIYHISRDISYEDKEVMLEQNFSHQLSQMLISYSSEAVKVITIGNEDQLWKDVIHSSKVEIFYILQELMTNMKKHSRADRAIIKFQKENSVISVWYSDNGIGIDKLSPKNGLKNTEIRIHSINGNINFDTETETGLKISISFPTKN